ncbi:MAG: serine hydrolase domain-containing protein [Ornithinibacter sp.]
MRGGRTAADGHTVSRHSRYRRTLAAAALLGALIAPTAGASAAAPGGSAATVSLDPPSTRSPADRDLQGRLTALRERHHADHEFVGAVLALQRRGGASVTATSGTKRLGHDSGAVDPKIPWGIGSITKTFVAVVVLQLAEEGSIDLDAGIEKYLPKLRGAERITPRELLQHTSGLGEYLDKPAVLNDAKRTWTPAELIAGAETAGRTGKPGAGYSYSNTDYIVLGKIIEQVTGRWWATEVRQRILTPLHMRHTAMITPHSAPGYGLVGDSFVDYTDRWDPSVGGAAGGLQSTSSDLLRFIQALAHGRLLSHASQEQMMTFIPAEDLSQFGVVDHEYGLGLELYSTDRVTVYGHLGSGAAHSAFIAFDRRSGASVVAMMNSENPGPQALMALEALTAATG